MTKEELPKLAIRPYPNRYVSTWTMKDGTEVLIRPIRPEDEPLMVKFHETLSERSVYLRYFHLMNLPQRVAHERLTRICFIDYDREMALVAERRNPSSGENEILAVGRLTRILGTQRRRSGRAGQRPFSRPRAGEGTARAPGDRGRRREAPRIAGGHPARQPGYHAHM